MSEGATSSCTVACVTEREAGDWDAYVRRHAGASGYHLWAWRHIFEHVFGHECAFLAARRGDRVVGVLPVVKFRSWLFGRALVSLPFVNYGGVLADDAEAGTALLRAVTEMAGAYGARHVELRHVSRHYAHLPCRQHKVAMQLRLGVTAAELWGRLDRKVRNQVRKAEHGGLESAEGGLELVPEFYEVFAHNMRDLGTPVYDRRLFEQVLTRFPGDARVFIVRLGARPVAAAVTYRFGDVIEVPWASSLKAFRALCPNMLLYWRMITRAADDGCRSFDFGRSTPHEGTYQFKKQWGAEPQALCWEYAALDGRPLPDHGPANPKFALAISTWKRVPVPIATKIGPHLVRNFA
jgi:FemAB-related protein (PEP-CTERM system-associated)